VAFCDDGRVNNTTVNYNATRCSAWDFSENGHAVTIPADAAMEKW
jgi:hypothetical protein